MHRQIGDPITWTFFNDDGSRIDLDNYYLPLDIFRRVFPSVGFDRLEFPPLTPDAEALTVDDDRYREDFLEFPPIMLIRAEL